MKDTWKRIVWWRYTSWQSYRGTLNQTQQYRFMSESQSKSKTESSKTANTAVISYLFYLEFITSILRFSHIIFREETKFI